MTYEIPNLYGVQNTNSYSSNINYLPIPLSYTSFPILEYKNISDKNNIINKTDEFKTTHQNLEHILSYFNKNSSTDPINQIWQDKLKIARFKISSLVNALALRDQIKHNNIYHIGQDICKIHTHQFALEDSSLFGYSINLAKFGLEKTACSLEGEVRSEIVSCWKDKLLMQKDLTEAIAEYLSLKRKMNLLGLNTKNSYND
ncbi:hypothetical protein MUP95_07185 [bacterium]|nr:hypothetical protein [bacterium]